MSTPHIELILKLFHNNMFSNRFRGMVSRHYSFILINYDKYQAISPPTITSLIRRLGPPQPTANPLCPPLPQPPDSSQ